MSEDTPLTPAVEARFQALAACVDNDTWSKLIGHTAERLLKRLAIIGVMADVDMAQLEQAREVVGEALVDYTNVALTCVAQGEIGPEPTP
jgi:hypothetical protein